MSFAEMQKALASTAPHKGKCDVCGAPLEKVPSVVVTTTVLFRKFKKTVCLMCSKEFRALIDLRITQAEKGEYQ